ncbi:MAG TPA: tetratricopeptide repeat protein [Novosphingobium sp.]
MTCTGKLIRSRAGNAGDISRSGLRRFAYGLVIILSASVAMAAPGGDLIAQSQAALARGDGIAAEVALRRALDAGAPRETVAAMMGEAFLDQEQPDKARDWLGPGRFSSDTAAYGFRLLARLEQQEGDLPAAGAAFDRALAITPNDATMWVEIGRLRYAGGEHMLALDASAHALELDPKNVRAIEFRGQIERDRVGLVAALPWFERALVIAPNDVSAMTEYAATLGEMGRAHDMLRVTRKVLELDPGNPRALFLQAVLAARAGNLELARGVMGRVNGKLDAMPAAMLLQGILEMHAGNYRLAMEVLERLVRQQPANIRAQLLLARAEFLAGEYRLLLSDFGAAAERPDASPYLLTLAGRAHEMLGRRDLAAALLDRAAMAMPQPLQPIAEGSPVGNLLATGSAADAALLADQGLSEADGSAIAQAIAGDMRLATGQGPAALEYYRRSARVRLSDGLMLRMAAALEESGDSLAAGRLAETYLAQHPGSIAAARIVASLAARRGDWPRTRTLLEHVRANGGDGDAMLLVELSLAQLRSGDAAAAEVTARSAYALQRARPQAAVSWGMALNAQHKEGALARTLLDKARSQGLR